jgi:fucose permease
MSLFGVVIVAPGTVLGFADMRARMGVSNIVLQGNLAALSLLALLVATLAVGPMIDRFGNKPVLVTSAGLAAISLASLATAHSYFIAVASAMMLGLSGGGLNTSTNALVSDLYEESRGAMLTYLAMFFGFGAMGLPLLAAALAPHVEQVLAASAVAALCCGLVYLASEFPPGRERHRFSLRDSLKVARYPGLMLFALLLLFESGNEQAMSSFLPRWADDVGASGRVASLVFALYPAGMMAGRLIMAPLLKRVDKIRAVLACGAVSVIAMTVLLLAHSIAAMALAAIMIGLSLSVVYPAVLAVAGDRYSRFAGSVFGFIFAVSLSGAVVSPWAIGQVSLRFGIHMGTVVPLAGTLGVTLLALRAATKPRPAASDILKQEQIASAE